MSQFGQVVEKKMDRARALIDAVGDREALQALNAIYDVLDLVFTEVSTPQYTVVDASSLVSKKEKDEKPQQMVQTKPAQSAGEKIAGKGGLYL